MLVPLQLLVGFFAVAFGVLHVRAFTGAWPDVVGLLTGVFAVLAAVAVDQNLVPDRPEDPGSGATNTTEGPASAGP